MAMTPERWRQITHIFHGARERDIEARRVFLDDACRSDPEIRSEVETLLAAHDGAGQFGDTPISSNRVPLWAHIESTS